MADVTALQVFVGSANRTEDLGLGSNENDGASTVKDLVERALALPAGNDWDAYGGLPNDVESVAAYLYLSMTCQHPPTVVTEDDGAVSHGVNAAAVDHDMTIADLVCAAGGDAAVLRLVRSAGSATNAKTEQLFVTEDPSGETLVVDVVHGVTKVEFVNMALLEMKQWPISSAPLTFDQTELDTYSTLGDYGIEKESTVHVVPNLDNPIEGGRPSAAVLEASGGGQMITVFCKVLTGRSETVEIDDLELVWSLKHKVEEQTHVPIEHMRFIFAGQELKDNRTLRSYNIQNEATVSMAMRLRGRAEAEPVPGPSDEVLEAAGGGTTISIFCKVLTGKTITIEIDDLMLVWHAKLMVEESEGIPAGLMRMIFAGMELDNERSLREYNIQKEATLHLVT